MLGRLENICRNDRELDNATSDWLSTISIYSEVYAELGMKAGARLLFQLLIKDT